MNNFKIINISDWKKDKKNKHINSIIRYNPFDGFKNEQELFVFMIEKKIKNICYYKILLFNNMFYAIGFEDFNKEVVFGKNIMWYVTKKKKQQSKTTKITTSKIPKIQGTITPCNVSNGISRDLCNYSNIREFNIEKDENSMSGYKILECPIICNCYINLLGLSFVAEDYFISKDNILNLKEYFKPKYLNAYYSIFTQNHFKTIHEGISQIRMLNIVALNPFCNTVIIYFPDEGYKIKSFFYEPIVTYYGGLEYPGNIIIDLDNKKFKEITSSKISQILNSLN